MSLQKEQIICQQCYICGTFFQDKVRLGVHIARCYEDAMDRGEHWHPHPDILLDEVRYSQYMLGGEREKKFKEAEKRKVAFSTQDEFANLHSQLGGSSMPKSSKGSQQQPQQQQPKFPASTYQSDFNKDAKTKAPLNIAPIDHVPKIDRPVTLSEQQERLSTPRDRGNSTPRFNLPTPTAPSPKSYGGGGHSSPSSSSPSGGRSSYALPTSNSSNNNNNQQQVSFAAPGVNTLRNELASELDKVRQFMQEEKRKSAERDAVLASVATHHHSSSPDYNYNPRANAAPSALKPPTTANSSSPSSPSSARGGRPNPLDGNNQFAPVPSNLRGGGGGGGGSGSGLPHIDMSSNTSKNVMVSARNQKNPNSRETGVYNPDEQIMETDIGQAIHGGGFEASPVERVPCGRCGRMFGPGKVAAHEEVCVSKPRGIHRR